MAEESAKRMEMIKQIASYVSAVVIIFMFWLLILRKPVRAAIMAAVSSLAISYFPLDYHRF